MRVYSFADASIILGHPSLGQIQLQGTGIGSVTVADANDMSSHDIAADGRAMTNKIFTVSGTVTLSIQQTSETLTWIRNAIRHVTNAVPAEFNQFYCRISSPTENVRCNGMSIQKRPDRQLQQTGQQTSISFLAEEIID